MREDECLNVSILGYYHRCDRARACGHATFDADIRRVATRHSLGSVIVYDLAMAQEGKLPAEGIQGTSSSISHDPPTHVDACAMRVQL